MSTSSSEEEGGGGGEFEAGSSSRRRMTSSSNQVVGVWPEPFLEALAFQVAIDASHFAGRLAAAQALFNLFQVCSTWRAISRSELLWQNLTRHIWLITTRLAGHTWRDEYIYRHRTAANFRLRRYAHATLPFVPTHRHDDGDALTCRRMALSDHRLAAGFSDGSVHLFHLPSGLHFSTFYPGNRDYRLGRFSSSVTGIVLSDDRLVFASLDGDVHVAVLDGGNVLRRAEVGNVVNDGALVDFAGSSHWWVGLYAGVPGRAFHIWNSETEELVFVGGTLTDPEAVMGWHLLTEMTDLIGRVRVTNHENAVACTSRRVIVFNLQNQGIVLGEEEIRRGVIVGAFDSNAESFLITDNRGRAILRRAIDLGENCRLTVRGVSQERGRILGCLNGGYGIICVGNVIRVWEIEHGECLYRFRERIGECSAIVADERYVAAFSSSHGIIHVWDFGAQ